MFLIKNGLKGDALLSLLFNLALEVNVEKADMFLFYEQNAAQNHNT